MTVADVHRASEEIPAEFLGPRQAPGVMTPARTTGRCPREHPEPAALLRRGVAGTTPQVERGGTGTGGALLHEQVPDSISRSDVPGCGT